MAAPFSPPEPLKPRNRTVHEYSDTSNSIDDARDLEHLLVESAKLSAHPFSQRRQMFWPFGTLCRLMTRDRIRHVLQDRLREPSSENLDFIIDQVRPVYESADVIPGLEEPLLPNEEAASKANGHLRILAVLLLLDRVESIVNFIESGVTDAHIPLESDEDHILTKRVYGKATTLEFLGPWRSIQFTREQFSVKTPFFEAPTPDKVHHYVFSEDVILPFLDPGVDEQLVSHGGSAIIIRVIIDPTCHGFHEILEEISIEPRAFAVKQIRNDLGPMREDFRRELAVLQMINGALHQRHLITLLATFEQGGRCHFVFPFAKCNLWHYWKDFAGPLSEANAPQTGDLAWLSTQISGLASALNFLHNPGGDIFARHGDIKPENILWYQTKGSFRGVLVICDFGASTVNREHNLSREGWTGDLVFTPKYRPPEFDMKDGPISRSSDIWNFGCVLLEMVCWIFDGIEGVDEFSKERFAMSTVHPLMEECFFEVLNGDGPHIVRVKQQVIKKILALHSDPRCTSYIHDLLDLIESRMLIVEVPGTGLVATDEGGIPVAVLKRDAGSSRRIRSPELVERLESMNGRASNPDYLSKPASWVKPQDRVESSARAEIDDRVPRMIAREVEKTPFAERHHLQRSMRIQAPSSLQISRQVEPGLESSASDHLRPNDTPRSYTARIKTFPDNGSVGTGPSLHQPLVDRADAARESPERKLLLEEIEKAVRTSCGGFLEDSTTIEATFSLQWELRRCIREELDGDADLNPVLTISGNASHSWATSCEDYVRKTWGELGTELLKKLLTVLDMGSPSQPLNQNVPGLNIQFPATDDEASMESIITFSGTGSQITVMAQLLVWVAATFRLPQTKKLSFSQARFSVTSSTEFSIQLEDLREPEGHALGTCWSPLFPSTVVAYDFPVPSVPGMLGLQVPLGIIIDLAEIMQDVTLEDDKGADAGTYLDGINWRLYPTEYNKELNAVQWHLTSKSLREDAAGLEFAPGQDEGPRWRRDVDAEKLGNATAIVGYCGEVHLHLGTKSRLQQYKKYRPSGAEFEKPAAEATISSFTGGANLLGKASASATITMKYKNGLKQGRAETKDTSLEDVLSMAAEEPIILFEMELGKERAWMVPQLSLVLDLYNFWASGLGKDQLKKIQYADLGGDAGKNAKAVLENTEYANQVVQKKILSKEEDTIVSDKIKQICSNIQNWVVKNADADEETGWSVRMGRTPMNGWDWLELTDSWTLSRRRDARREGNIFTKKEKPAWLKLTKHVPLLLGRGMGQVITPVDTKSVCRNWYPVPGGFESNYLVAPVKCLQSLANKYGDKATWLLLERLSWDFCDKGLFHPCRPSCSADPKACPKLPQRLCERRNKLQKKGVPRLAERIPKVEEGGAVIFGANRKSEKQLAQLVAEEEINGGDPPPTADGEPAADNVTPVYHEDAVEEEAAATLATLVNHESKVGEEPTVVVERAGDQAEEQGPPTVDKEVLEVLQLNGEEHTPAVAILTPDTPEDDPQGNNTEPEAYIPALDNTRGATTGSWLRVDDQGSHLVVKIPIPRPEWVRDKWHFLVISVLTAMLIMKYLE